MSPLLAGTGGLGSEPMEGASPKAGLHQKNNQADRGAGSDQDVESLAAKRRSRGRFESDQEQRALRKKAEPGHQKLVSSLRARSMELRSAVVVPNGSRVERSPPNATAGLIRYSTPAPAISIELVWSTSADRAESAK